MIYEYVEDVSTKEKQKEFDEIVNVLIEYHNSYKKEKHTGNWLDFLYIIPINLSAIKTKSNKDKINTYKFIISTKIDDIISKLNEIKPITE
jgi:hypothetical protein